MRNGRARGVVRLGIRGGMLLMLLSTCSRAPGETLRVTTWDLGSAGSTNAEWSQEAAGVLGRLNADVILLQGVRDWAACERLAHALRPAEYHVAVCSSFPGGPSNSVVYQTAILSKARAYVSWAEPWRLRSGAEVDSGLVFAALEFPSQRIGFFSAAASASLGPEQTCEQLEEQIATVKAWTANQAQSLFLGARFPPVRGAGPILKQIVASVGKDGLRQVLPWNSSSVLFAGPAVLLVATLRLGVVPSFGTAPVMCNFEIDPVKVAAAEAVLARQQVAASPAGVSGAGPWGVLREVWYRTGWLFPVGTAVLVSVLGLAWGLVKRRARAAAAVALLAARSGHRQLPSASYTVVVAPPRVGEGQDPEQAMPLSRVVRFEPPGLTHTQSAEWQQRALAAEEQSRRAQEALRRGLLPEFRRWLKHRFVRQLAEDRAQLIQSQQVANHKAAAVDQRLARLEAQIQQQNQAYLRRIEELTRELLSAKEESRELIRARIGQIREEMESARARLMAQAQDDRGR